MLRLLIVSLGLALIGCSSRSPERPRSVPILAGDVAPGTILLDVDGGGPYWQYEIKPSAGTLRLIREDKSQDNYLRRAKTFQKPTGAIDGCENLAKPEATSTDGKFLARCLEVSRRVNNLLVIDVKDSAPSYQWQPQGRHIQGFAWAPNSRSVAVLNDSSYIGLSPLEILEALSGHPVSHCTVYLDIIEANTGNVTAYPVAGNVTNSWERILSWSE
jgi:dipeptidyl aminopeptidase/acylaminoacyl peptidase